MDMTTLFRETVERNASDLHISAGTPPHFRVDGQLVVSDLPPLTPEESRNLCYGLLTQSQKIRFEQDRELDFAHLAPGLCRFRVNLFIQRESVAAAFRPIPYRIPTFEELRLPVATMERIASLKKGLVLVTGAKGSGKSTTLAAVIDYINERRTCHIVSVEDPIEYYFKHKRSLIHQRQIESDTRTFADALKHIFRQDTDIVLIGEMRDAETVRAALTLAETGSLVLSTLHAGEALEVPSRIVDMFPIEHQVPIRSQLSLVLSHVVAQQLLPRTAGGRIVATEVLVGTSAVKTVIREGKPHDIYNQILLGRQLGMSTMNESLRALLDRNEISLETALEYSLNPVELQRSLKEQNGAASAPASGTPPS